MIDQYCYLPEVINGVMEREDSFLLVCSNYCYETKVRCEFDFNISRRYVTR